MTKRCVDGIVCVEEVWRRVERLAEGSPVMTTSVETPKAVADVCGGCTDGDETKAKGVRRHTLVGLWSFTRELWGFAARVVPVSDRRDSLKYKRCTQT